MYELIRKIITVTIPRTVLQKSSISARYYKFDDKIKMESLRISGIISD